MERNPRSDAMWHKRAEAFARLDALPRKALRSMSSPRIASLAMTTEVFVRAWIEARNHTDLMRHNPVIRDAVFARLDALPIEQVRGRSLYQVSRMARTSIPYVRTWIKARGLHRLIAYDQDRWLIELYQQTPLLQYQHIAAHMRLPYTTVYKRISALQSAGVLQPRDERNNR
jgi:hypothetical protein